MKYTTSCQDKETRVARCSDIGCVVLYNRTEVLLYFYIYIKIKCFLFYPRKRKK